MKRAAGTVVKVVAVMGLMALTMGAAGNSDPERTGPANDGGKSGYNDTGGNGGSSSRSGCSK